MTKRIFQAICLVAAAVLVCSTAVLLALFYDQFVSRTQQDLRAETAYVAQGMEAEGEKYLDALKDRSRRITLVESDGTVVYDNQADPATMENHAQREEIAQALSTGSGEARRMSATLAQETFYCASRLSDGSVLRLAVTENSIWALLLAVLQPAAVVVIVVLIFGAILANRVARRIVAPVNALDLEHPEQNDGSYEELSPLLSKIARQKRTIESQLSQAQKRQEHVLRPRLFRVETDRLRLAFFQDIFQPRTVPGPLFYHNVPHRGDQFIHHLQDTLLIHSIGRQDLSGHAGIHPAQRQKKMLCPDLIAAEALCFRLAVLQDICKPRADPGVADSRRIPHRRDQFFHYRKDPFFVHPVGVQDLSGHPGVDLS